MSQEIQCAPSSTISKSDFEEIKQRPSVCLSDYPLNQYMLKKEEYIMDGEVLVLERHWVNVDTSASPALFTERRTCPNGCWGVHRQFEVVE